MISFAKWRILFAVATTNTCELFSDNHVKSVLRTLLFVPLSLEWSILEKALSISFIHSTYGADACISFIVFLTWASDSPEIPWNIWPISGFNNNKFHSDAIFCR